MIKIGSVWREDDNRFDRLVRVDKITKTHVLIHNSDGRKTRVRRDRFEKAFYPSIGTIK